jgi:hypothetical protein
MKVAHNRVQKQQAQYRSDYKSGKLQIKNEDVKYFIYPEPIPIQIDFKIHSYNMSGFIWMPLYKNMQVTYRAEIIFSGPSPKKTVFVDGVDKLNISGFCSAYEARRLLAQRVARAVRMIAVNAYLTNYEDDSPKLP